MRAVAALTGSESRAGLGWAHVHHQDHQDLHDRTHAPPPPQVEHVPRGDGAGVVGGVWGGEGARSRTVLEGGGAAYSILKEVNEFF